MCEDAILVERIVAHHHALEQVAIEYPLLLMEAACQEAELSLEWPPFRVLIKPFEKRILLELLDDEFPLAPLREKMRERRLAGSNHALDDDVAQFLRQQQGF